MRSGSRVLPGTRPEHRRRVAPYPTTRPEYGQVKCAIPDYLPEHEQVECAIPAYPPEGSNYSGSKPCSQEVTNALTCETKSYVVQIIETHAKLDISYPFASDIMSLPE